MRVLILLFLCCSLMSGCAQEHIVDRINILQSMGVDLEGETIKVSASYPKYIHGAGEQSPINGDSNVMFGVFTDLTSKSSQPVEIGQMRTLVLSEQFANKSMAELANIINREIIKSSNATIVITRQSAHSIIDRSSKEPPYYLSELIEQNMFHGNTPRTNYHSFVNQYYREGQDVYLPVINEDQGVLKMDGIAVFKGDGLKLWLNRDEGLYLKLLKDKTRRSEYDFKTSAKAMYSLIILHGKSKVDLRQNKKAKVSLQLSVQLRETPKNLNLQRKHDLEEARKQLEVRFTSEITAMLLRLQKNGVDPLGLGEQYRRQHRSFNEKQFYGEIYPNLNFEVESKISILHSGVGQ